MLTAQITGGLGNQLFTYARLATYAHEHGIELRIDGSIVERVLGKKPDLFDFHLLGEPQTSANTYSPIATQLERLLWRSRYLRDISRRHQETELGRREISRKSLDGWKVRGFFQDFRVADQFIDTFGKSALTLKNESNELIRMSESLNEKKVMAIHVRRGDYLNYKDSFGLLGNSYYLNAVKILNEKREFSSVMIFTDSPELVGDLRNQLTMESHIVEPEALSTSETLILMSRCSGLVTSNSTFSFWAAILGNDLNVVVPNPWFKSNDPWLRSADFMNPKWSKQKADWSRI